MNKKIVMSLATIGAVGAIAIGGTIAYFSDTETATGTFTAGTIDIAVDGENPWTKTYDTGDLKPGQTGNINFNIQNVGQNDVNVSKSLSKFIENTGIVSEPECTDQGGTWDNVGKACDWSSCPGGTSACDKNNVESQIIYDLNVEVFDANNKSLQWQEIYADKDGHKVSDVYANDGSKSVQLGMIPAGGHMMVKQSYHFSKDAGNEYQGDTLGFTMTIKAEQLPQGDAGMASVVLENKSYDNGNWLILSNDNIKGTLSYKVQGPTFDYNFVGVAPLANQNYVLAIGYNASTDVDTQVATGMSDGSGNISLSGSATIASMNNAKAWLVPAENWSGTAMNWAGGAGWPGVVPNFLWETGLINYTKN